MSVSLENNSGVMIEKVEVEYPGGGYGFNSMPQGMKDQREVGTMRPCWVVVRRQEKGTLLHSQRVDLGSKCPRQLGVELRTGGNTEIHVLKP